MPGVQDETSGVAAAIAARAVANAVTLRNLKIAVIPLAAIDTGGGVVSFQNPEGVDVIITRVDVDVSTKSNAACTVDIGVTSVSGTTSSNNLMTGLDVGAAAGLFDNIDEKGASGKTRQILPAGKWLTASKASGASAGLIGNLIVHYYFR